MSASHPQKGNLPARKVNLRQKMAEMEPCPTSRRTLRTPNLHKRLSTPPTADSPSITVADGARRQYL
jgi:hypothetical protein